jgi:hypothetical protein
MNEVAGSPSDASGELRRAIKAMALGAALAVALVAARDVAARSERRR